MPVNAFRRDITVSADLDACWKSLTDVNRLVSWVGIIDQTVELAHLQKYTAVLMDRLGPFKLRADLDVTVSDVDEPHHLRVQASGEDRQVSSRISIDVVMNLKARDEGGTLVEVTGTHEVVGKVATLGAGMIRHKATKILDEFAQHATAELGQP